MTETKRAPSLNTALAREYVGNLKKTLLRELKTDDPLERWVHTFVHDVRESRSPAIAARLKKTISEKSVFNAVKRLLGPQLKKAKAEATREKKATKRVKTQAKKSPKRASKKTHSAVESSKEETLSEFAARAVNTAKKAKTGRWHGNMFMAPLWRQMSTTLTLPEFKARLFQAHQDGLLELSRADLVEAMPSKDVSDSEFTHSGARFHFLRVD